MAYSTDNPVVQTLLRILRRRHASPKVAKSAFQTGAVESNFTNPSGGDADSAGWRQERASLYPNPTNLEASINRYIDEANKLKGKYGTAGALAAAVQRPAAQYRGRYQEASPEISNLFKAYMGGRGGDVATAGGATAAPQASSNEPSRVSKLIDVIQSLNPPQAPEEAAGAPTDTLSMARAMTGRLQAQQAQSLEMIKALGERKAASDSPPEAASVSSGGGGVMWGKGYASPERSKSLGKIIGTPGTGTHTLGNWQSDNAVDIAMPTGTVIQSMQDGVVEKVKGGYSGGQDRFDGYQITVRFKDGNRAFYTHLSKAGVKPGQRVKAGQALGRSGAANGVEHLHLGVEHGDPPGLRRRQR